MNNARPRMEVIPAIDLLDGTIVRLFQGDFEQVTQYIRDPIELAKRYADAGARRLHVVDLDGARTGEGTNLPIIERLAKLDIEVQAGGGIRDAMRLRRLLDAGVTRSVIGSVAIKQPELVTTWLAEFGADAIILAVDVQVGDDGEPELLTDGWLKGSGKSLWPVVDHYLANGATEFLCTDIAKDGTLQGPNLDLYRSCVERYPDAQFIASGGVSSAADLDALAATGVTRVVTGKALLDGRLTVEEISRFSRGA
ncbi:MAG: 1-(5-phosphoribosyl)-5-[(5-phosphoribosylamino)methylideneamino]imidazole-4-carboxamide isomerase [Gammaproteobacteria bacterium]|nr:MAG: 1-(5-phosphoribosyl)-5-[(5-phosphoribosylamino)methylideneamino]imidazole-4-carboxamide isomerase [Gammaproteobacteria bacterium]